MQFSEGESEMYDSRSTSDFYDAYGEWEWNRLETSAYGRLQALIHRDFLERYLRSGWVVLDAGGGPGRFSLAMAEIGANVTLLDISKGQLRIARQKMASGSQMNRLSGLVSGDVATLPFRDRSFDAVVCYGGPLSYVCEQRFQALRELVRVTKQGGIILASVMSRLWASANAGRRPFLPDWHQLWRVIETGDQPPVPSSKAPIMHPAMHLYTSMGTG